jgi:hypothetical protein
LPVSSLFPLCLIWGFWCCGDLVMARVCSLDFLFSTKKLY